MGKIKDALELIAERLANIRDLQKIQINDLREIKDDQKGIKYVMTDLIDKLDDLQEFIQSIDRIGDRQKDELISLNNMLSDFGEMLEEQQMAGQDAQLLRVMPAENAGKEALFVVTGDELANLLEACSGATLRMKKKEGDKK